jgi:hypothetical protein
LALFDAKTLADLTKLSTPTLTRAFDDLGFTTKDRGAVELALSKATSQDGTTALAKSVDAQRMATMFPWVPAEEKAIRQLRRFADDWATNGEAKAMATLKQEYIARAKAGMLTPTEALIGQYTLFCSSDDTKYGSFMLMSLMLRVPVDDRVSIHNWAIAQEMPNATKEAYGAAIAQLSFPLFPVDEQLTATNTKLLTGISPSGGSVNTVFATQPTGAGGLPLLQATGGTYGVDTTPIEQAFGSEIQNLRREVANLRSRLNAANQQANVANQQANTTAGFAAIAAVAAGATATADKGALTSAVATQLQTRSTICLARRRSNHPRRFNHLLGSLIRQHLRRYRHRLLSNEATTLLRQLLGVFSRSGGAKTSRNLPTSHLARAHGG